MGKTLSSQTVYGGNPRCLVKQCGEKAGGLILHWILRLKNGGATQEGFNSGECCVGSVVGNYLFR